MTNTKNSENFKTVQIFLSECGRFLKISKFITVYNVEYHMYVVDCLFMCVYMYNYSYIYTGRDVYTLVYMSLIYIAGNIYKSHY